MSIRRCHFLVLFTVLLLGCREVQPREPGVASAPDQAASPAAKVFNPTVTKNYSPGAPTQAPQPTVQPTPQPAVGAFDPARTNVRLERVVTGLRQPVGIATPGDGSGRLFIVEKNGTIRIVRNGSVVSEPFFDVTALIGKRNARGELGYEQGLLGLAFHPQYRANGFFYINYTDRNGDTVVDRYHRTDNPDRADPNSAARVLFVDQPFDNHNGGHLLFG
ncbi:MAG: PQQ-dependent sugar dehydrogenase, partial [Chloroflexi bacterium]|nr:PQQ-dependent sugar dehydrogenase [Chloroflexota bacterium]